MWKKSTAKPRKSKKNATFAAEERINVENEMLKNLILMSSLLVVVGADGMVGSENASIDDRQKEDDYVLVFSDEFNLPDGSQPNSTYWSCPPRSNDGWNRWVVNSPAVTFIKGGALVCRAIPNRSIPTDTAQMLTGAVFTKDRFEFRYGKVEVRMKTNLRVGNFPAAWLRTWATAKQPLYSEIDIVEMFGNKRESNHTAHSELTVHKRNHGLKNHFGVRCDVNKWHVYGVEWTDNMLIWTIDGKKVGEYRKADDAKLLAEGQWSFDYPLFIVLNQSVGTGGYDFFMPQTNKIYETRFDWVRVYQKKVK